MTAFALGLVLLSALCHATWNLLLKRAGRQEVFAWALLISTSILLLPLGVALLLLNPIAGPGYWFVLVSAGLQAFYFVMLGRAYSRGDLGLVYPIARGIGPMLVPVLAVVLLGERVALPAVIGIALIVVGIYVVSWWGRLRQILARPWALLRDAGVRYAIVTGMTITVYSLVDKRAVEHVQPFLYMYLLTIVSAVALAPYILRRYGPALVREEWASNARAIVVAGLLFFVAYGLALTAFSLSQVSYVAPAREVGIVFGVLLGMVVLKEQSGAGRLLGAVLVVAGMGLIALSP